MMIFYLGILAGFWYIGYSMGKAAEKLSNHNQLEQQIAFNEQLDIERKKAADETKRQIKFETDTRAKIRKQIEKEERDK